MERVLGNNRDWWQRGSHSLRKTGFEPGNISTPDRRLRHFLELSVTHYSTEEEEQHWAAALETLQEFDSALAFADDEPGVVLAEALAALVSPSRLLPFFKRMDDDTQRIIVDQWRRLTDAIPLSSTPPAADYVAAARAYASYRAGRLADCLQDSFIEGGDSPCSAGDLYLTRDDRYFFNFSYLCGEFNLGRDEAIGSLRALGRMLAPTDDQLERLGGADSFSRLIHPWLVFEGDRVPQALGELLPLVELPFTEVTSHLPRALVSKIAVTAVARRLGFELAPSELLEIYEVLTVYEALGNQRDDVLAYLHNLYALDPKEGAEGACPPDAWQEDWLALIEKVSLERVTKVVLDMIPVYSRFGEMLNGTSFHRATAAWQAAFINNQKAAEWVVRTTTHLGEASPVIAASLLHKNTPPDALARLATIWKTKSSAVPAQSSWSREFTILLLRYAITRQRAWLLDRLTDLYLRAGGYEAGETREVIETILEQLLQEMKLTPEERQELDESNLHLDLLPFDINIFTGETVDASRWASPTSAYKYVRALLRLEDRGLDYLASLVSERRVISIEKALSRLDFHTSVQQIVSCVEAYEGNPEKALNLLLILRSSSGERPSDEWLEEARELLSELTDEDGNTNRAGSLLWEIYRADMGDEYSLNPGIFWALRLVPSSSSVSHLAKAATEMVRRKPSFAIAALDTLDSISTRGALSAILQMRRRIRNRKVVKLINHTIDRIAEEGGLDRDVFLDYAVDAGELERGSHRLFDFGSHQVTLKLELDGHISTTVLDAKGRHLRSFPKTAKDADPALYKEFQATKKLLTETIGYQTRRLELSMIDGRVWSGGDFLDIFQEHPVMSHLGQRLLWMRSRDGKNIGAFLPTPDGFVDQHNEELVITPDDNTSILHPLILTSEDRNDWNKVFTIRKVKQPFEQVARDVFSPLESETETRRTQRLVGLESPSSELYKVVKERGWSTDGGGPWEVGNATHSYRRYTAAEQTVHLETDVLGYEKRLTIQDIRFTTHDNNPLEIASVHPIVYSEAFRDLMLCLNPKR